MKKKAISQAALTVLSTVKIDGSNVTITNGQLERKLYEEVNLVLTELGGKWNRKARAHLFDADPTLAIERVINSGEIVTAAAMGFFQTPAPIVERLLDRAMVKKDERVLEPSAGMGAIALALVERGAEVTCVEIDPARSASLPGKLRRGVFVTGDFLDCVPGGLGTFEKVVMNPPFAGQADIDHVYHAMSFLRPGGRLVSIMSAGVAFRENKKTLQFRDWVKKLNGTIEPLPEGSFSGSGTNVNTVLVTADRS